ncbi:MAG: hypothetical protein NTX04_00620 [Verrucomicrobia bacterium]|nr:hypothetical protein [Verrucomicrobiota bacterium]
MKPSAPTHPSPTPLAILINGPSSSGKSTLCRALQDRLTDLADGNPHQAFARVAFDDVALLMSDKLQPISFVSLKGGDLSPLASQLASRTPHDGRAGWEYLDDSLAEGKHGGSPRLRLALSPFARRLLSGLHQSWANHLQLGTHLIIDHFLQEESWSTELLTALRKTPAHLFSIGVFCSLTELERRESFRADGAAEGRPQGLARRSDELCHAQNLDYQLTVHTDQQTTRESVDSIILALQKARLLAP